MWICLDDAGHLQATGRDARGRKQYRYHTAFRAAPRRGEVRPPLRVRHGASDDPQAGRDRSHARAGCHARRCSRRSSGCSRRRSCGSATRSTPATNGSYGLTTLRDRHAHVHERRTATRVQGQARHRRERARAGPAPAARRQAVPGPPRSGAVPVPRRGRSPAPVTSTDVNAYLRDADGSGRDSEGLPHLDGHAAGHGRARRAPATDLGPRHEARGDPSPRGRVRPSRQHAGGVPQRATCTRRSSRRSTTARCRTSGLRRPPREPASHPRGTQVAAPAPAPPPARWSHAGGSGVRHTQPG